MVQPRTIGPRIQSRIKPFNKQAVSGMVKDVTQYIQDEKIRISRGTIRGFQNLDMWPEEYYSYVGSERRNNRYKDPARFFRVMHSRPLKYYRKRFIFRPIIDVSGVLKDAAGLAFNLTLLKASGFGRVKNLYHTSFKMTVNGELATPESLDNLNEDSVIQIYNTAPYAGRLEALAFYRASMGGVLYYAAEKVKAAYPQVSVNFSYKNPGEIYGSYGTTGSQGQAQYYAVPVITLGSRGTVIEGLKKPGKNIRRRERHARKMQRLRE